jgi:hypothetical protein
MVKKIIIWSFGLVLASLLSCEKSPTETEEPTDNRVILNGQVLNAASDTPIAEAVIRVLNLSPEIVEVTNSEGIFNIEFELEDPQEIRLVAFKESFRPDTTLALAVPGRTISVPSLSLAPTTETPTRTGPAASVILAAQSTFAVGVHESGSVETAELIFEVQDSTGTPVSLAQAVTVEFQLGAAPGGGEFLYPKTATTSNSGQVSVYLTSGTRAGVIQIIAQIRLGAKLMRSKPVALTIHGGLPDLLHFSLAPDKLNFPGYNIFGLENIITAFVGDKYANPVKPGTSVYFTTTGGIIGGNANTCEFAQANVTLLSADPRPNHPTLGPGFATISGSTVDENQNTITATTIVLFSGVPQISISPTWFDIPNGSAQTFFYAVHDQHGNPLAGGTTITVTVSGDNLKSSGALNKLIPDTQSRGWTQFSFTVFDAVPDSIQSVPVSILVSTTGPNGGADLGISGTSN